MINTEFKCKSTANDIKTIYYFELSDFVVIDGVIVRKKRKYGKFKRPVYRYDVPKPL